MKHLTLRNILALLLSLGLGTAVMAQSTTATAEGSGATKTSQKQDDSAKSASDAKMSKSGEKARDFQQWTQSEEPGDNVDEYAKNGLSKLDDALGAVVEDMRAMPMGGGPVADSKDKSQHKDKMGETAHKAEKMGEDALNKIKSEQQKLSKIADDIGGDAQDTQSAEQFHEAATSAANIFASLQESSFPALEKDVERVKKSADKLDASKSLASQDKQVADFFKESSSVIDKMSENLESDAIGGGPGADQEKKPMDDSEQKSQQQEDSVMPEMK